MCRFSVPMEEGDFRVFLHCHFGSDPTTLRCGFFFLICLICGICLTSFWVSFRRNHFLYVAVDAVRPWKEVNLGSSYVTSQTETFFLNGHTRNEDLEEKCKFHCKGK